MYAGREYISGRNVKTTFRWIICVNEETHALDKILNERTTNVYIIDGTAPIERIFQDVSIFYWILWVDIYK